MTFRTVQEDARVEKENEITKTQAERIWDDIQNFGNERTKTAALSIIGALQNEVIKRKDVNIKNVEVLLEKFPNPESFEAQYEQLFLRLKFELRFRDERFQEYKTAWVKLKECLYKSRINIPSVLNELKFQSHEVKRVFADILGRNDRNDLARLVDKDLEQFFKTYPSFEDLLASKQFIDWYTHNEKHAQLNSALSSAVLLIRILYGVLLTEEKVKITFQANKL